MQERITIVEATRVDLRASGKTSRRPAVRTWASARPALSRVLNGVMLWLTLESPITVKSRGVDMTMEQSSQFSSVSVPGQMITGNRKLTYPSSTTTNGAQTSTRKRHRTLLRILDGGDDDTDLNVGDDDIEFNGGDDDTDLNREEGRQLNIT